MNWRVFRFLATSLLMLLCIVCQADIITPIAITEGETGKVTISRTGSTSSSLDCTIFYSNSSLTGPSTVTIPSGATKATFDITASEIALDTTTSISVSLNGQTETESISVQALPAPQRTSALINDARLVTLGWTKWNNTISCEANMMLPDSTAWIACDPNTYSPPALPSALVVSFRFRYTLNSAVGPWSDPVSVTIPSSVVNLVLLSTRNSDGSILLDWNEIPGAVSYTVESRWQGTTTTLETCAVSEYKTYDLSASGFQYRVTCTDSEGRKLTSNWVVAPVAAPSAQLTRVSSALTVVESKLFGVAYRVSGNVSLPCIFSLDPITNQISFEAYLPLADSTDNRTITYDDRLIEYGSYLLTTYTDGFDRKLVAFDKVSKTVQEISGLLSSNIVQSGHQGFFALASRDGSSFKEIGRLSHLGGGVFELSFDGGFEFSDVSDDDTLFGASTWLSSGGNAPHFFYSGVYSLLSYGGSQGFGGVVDVRQSQANNMAIIGEFPALPTELEQDIYSISGPMIQTANDIYGFSTTGGLYGGGCIFTLQANPGQAAGIPTITILENFKISENSTANHFFRPIGSPCLVGNTIYGCASSGGVEGFGAIFRFNAGVLSMVHSFTLADGIEPNGTLTLAPNGLLYGTTKAGGLFGKGTLFSIDSLGNFKVVLNFGS